MVIKNNPGFKVLLNKNSFTQILSLKIYNINNINYVHTLPIYINAFLKLITGKSVEGASKICKSGAVKVGDDIVAAPEGTLLESKTVSIVEDGVAVFARGGLMERLRGPWRLWGLFSKFSSSLGQSYKKT